MNTEKIKMTRQRMVILETLEKSHIHPTADELYELVRKKIPHISLATVYRNLESLSEAGLVRKLEFAGCQKRFDITTSDHHHIRCLGCGAVEDIPCDCTKDTFSDIDKKTDYEVVGFHLEFTGYCPRCAGKMARKNKREK